MDLLFKYEMKSRPFGIGCQPKGHINYEEKVKSKDGCWGILTYDRKLSPEEIYSYELKEL